MSGPDVVRVHLTAKPRRVASFPARFLVERGLIRQGERVLDYGCGRGVDVAFLRGLGVEAYCYDPYFYPDESVLRPRYYDVVTSFFVLNVLLPDERYRVIRELARLVKPDGRVYVAVRSDKDTTIRGVPHADGVLTSKGTFQKPYSPEELERELSMCFGDVRILLYDSRRVIAEAREPRC